MSSPVNNFLTLIPTAHRVHITSPFTTSVSSIDSTANEESIVPILQKTRRSSSTATADSNIADEPSLPSETELVESPTEDVNVQVTVDEEQVEQPVVVQPISVHRFLKLGN